MKVGSNKQWVLVLGGSSGLGLATAIKMAQQQYNIIIIHRDRRADLPQITSNFEKITSLGVQLKTFNADAVNHHKRKELIQEISTLLGSHGNLKMLVHSIAKGSLKPMFSSEEDILSHQDFQITVDAMALSLYDWVRDLVAANCFGPDARIVAYTSEGNTKAWQNYAAVSVAKVALEALIRNIALEFAPIGIKANGIQAGMTDTKSFQRIPNSIVLKKNALLRNPNKRLTTPEDIANVAYLLSTDEAKWITGTVLKVDGGESLQ